MFLESGFDYQLFVDADLEFEPDVVGRMILSKRCIFVCLTEKNTRSSVKIFCRV